MSHDWSKGRQWRRSGEFSAKVISAGALVGQGKSVGGGGGARDGLWQCGGMNRGRRDGKGRWRRGGDGDRVGDGGENMRGGEVLPVTGLGGKGSKGGGELLLGSPEKKREPAEITVIGWS